MMGMDCTTDIAAMNEDKNISLEDLKQTLGIIMATRVQRVAGRSGETECRQTVGQIRFQSIIVADRGTLRGG